MKNFILTLDYELYGDGSGDVFRHIIEPTKRLLRLAAQYNAKLTFFFEVVEYWKLKEEWEKGNHMGYARNPAKAMEAQIRQAVSQGHDVQLHIHPQWVNASYDDNRWRVDLEDWRLSDCSVTRTGKLAELLAEGKETLERLIRPVKADYVCLALRAGGYNAQPSDKIIAAMREVGLYVDSSVVPGAVEKGALSAFDYKNAPTDRGYWYCDGMLEQPSQSRTDVLEFPIVAFPIRRYEKYLSYNRMRALLQNRKSARKAFDAKTSGGKGCLLSKMKYFLEVEQQTWDYCLFSNSMNKHFCHDATKQDRDLLVLVGHPKSLVSLNGLRNILKSNRNDGCFYSLTDANNEINSLR